MFHKKNKEENKSNSIESCFMTESSLSNDKCTFSLVTSHKITPFIEKYLPFT